MRTKTTILSAVALAAGLLSSHAQVYSANIVGYANVTCPGGNAFSLLTVPVGSATKTNVAEVALSAINIGDNVFTWTGVGYNGYTYLGTDGAGVGFNWIDAGGNPSTGPALKAGQGFFYQNSGSNLTNTFVGEVIRTNSVSLPGGNAFSLVGSAIPFGGLLESTNFALAAVAGVGDNVFIWTGTGYNGYTYLGPDGAGPGTSWIDAGGNPSTGPSVSVGQAFFYQNANSTINWSQQLP